jgi:hypothetical protein
MEPGVFVEIVVPILVGDKDQDDDRDKDVSDPFPPFLI